MTVQQVSGYLPRGLLLDHLKMCEMITPSFVWMFIAMCIKATIMKKVAKRRTHHTLEP